MPALKFKPQGGLSLIELLVCLGLAMLISLAAVAAAISARASLSSQDESSRLVDTGLYALSVIDRAVRQAGFEQWNGTQDHGGDSLSPAVLGLDDASLPLSSVALAGAATPGLNHSDVLALRYVGSGSPTADGSMLNCAGVGVAEPAPGDLENGRGWSIFHVSRTDPLEPELRCKYRSEDGLKWDSQAVASGVEAMQVLYGVDQDGDGLPERYLRASAMVDAKAWRSVVSLRVSLLVRSSQFQSDAPGNRVHDLFAGAYANQAGQQDAGVRIDEGKLAVSYGLNAQEAIDYDAMERLAREKKPKLLIAGASAYSLHIDFERISRLAKEIGAYFMVDMAHYAGLIAAGVYPNPVPHADFVTSTTHKSLRGPRGGVILMKAEHEKAINSAIFPGIQGGPLMHVIAAKAVAFKEAMAPEFKTYQQQVVKNADVLARTLIQRGLRIVSGGTQSHVMLVDLRAKKITGKEAEAILGSAHMTCNKNAIPNDPEKPFVTSGIRLGSPAMTTRGFKEAEAAKVGELIADVLDHPHGAATIERVKAEVKTLTDAFPVYQK